jgi:SPP1 family predicted phage head-tail adaptor
MRSRNPGNKNKKIVIKSPVLTYTKGDVVKTWVTLATVWADERPMRMDERYASDARHSMRVANFRIWFRDDVTPEMAVEFEGLTWRITGLAEVGFREELDITAEAIY